MTSNVKVVMILLNIRNSTGFTHKVKTRVNVLIST
jgi:hypothetical protein